MGDFNPEEECKLMNVTKGSYHIYVKIKSHLG